MATANIRLLGATYSDVPAVTLPTAEGGTATFSLGGGGSSQRVLCGELTPSSSVGSNGDLYMILSGGGSVEAYPADYTASGMSSTSNASACIDKSADNGSSTANMYSSDSGSTGVVEYTFDLSGIPANAIITSVSCRVKAHEENSSRSAFTLQLYAGSTAKGSKTTVSGTSNTIYTLTTGTWTRSEIDQLVLHTEYGYYGGLVAGATLTVEYSADKQASATLTLTADGWALSGDLYQKGGGAWAQVSSAAIEDTISRT